MTHTTYNAYHLGDNLLHLHFLRKLAQAYPDEQFAHYCNPQHHPQVAPVIAGLTNIRLLEVPPTEGINAWRGDGGFWYAHPHRHEFTRFHFDWFALLAGKMGLKSPITTADDMLFDYDAIKNGLVLAPFDYLIINSIPHSGQFRTYNPHEFTRLVQKLLDAGKSVITTFPTNANAQCTHNGTSGLSVTDIGSIARFAGSIIGIPTGPMWPTYNVWAREQPRIVLLDSEQVNIAPNTRHVRTVQEAIELL